MVRCRARRAVTGSKLLVVTLLASMAATAALAADTVSNTLSVSRVVRAADGAEHKESASSAKPGDVLEYQATYRNSGAGTVRKLQATIPIPGGATYVPGSTLPANAMASLDGIDFERIPLKRQVRKPDGATTEQLVATSDYRFVRWTLDELAPDAVVTVAVRVSVTNEQPPAAAKVQP
jgi:uncharacterized repeat protein (TIGR01451 family)